AVGLRVRVRLVPAARRRTGGVRAAAVAVPPAGSRLRCRPGRASDTRTGSAVGHVLRDGLAGLSGGQRAGAGQRVNLSVLSNRLSWRESIRMLVRKTFLTWGSAP